MGQVEELLRLVEKQANINDFAAFAENIKKSGTSLDLQKILSYPNILQISAQSAGFHWVIVKYLVSDIDQLIDPALLHDFKTSLSNLEDIDASPTEGSSAGKTILLYMAACNKGQAILLEMPSLLLRGNLDAYPHTGDYAGVTVLWLLSATSNGKLILQKNPELLLRGNINASPLVGKQVGETVLWLQTTYQEGIAILQKYPELLAKGNLDATPFNGEHAGETVLWRLVTRPEGRMLLLSHTEPLLYANIDAAPLRGENAGKTVLWFLAANQSGREILQENPMLLFRGNLNAAPLTDKGKTAFWFLSATPTGKKIIINSPELFVRGDLYKAPQADMLAFPIWLWGTSYKLLLEHPKALLELIFIFRQTKILTEFVSFTNNNPTFARLANLANVNISPFSSISFFSKFSHLPQSKDLTQDDILNISIELLSSKKFPTEISGIISYFYSANHFSELKLVKAEAITAFINRLREEFFLNKLAVLILSEYHKVFDQGKPKKEKLTQEQTISLKKEMILGLKNANKEKKLPYTDKKFRDLLITKIKGTNFNDPDHISKITDATNNVASEFAKNRYQFNQSTKSVDLVSDSNDNVTSPEK